jgi:hypothetical protein
MDNYSPHLSTKVDTRIGDWAEANIVELAYVPFYRSSLNRIEAQFTALRYFALDGSDHPSHREQASMILLRPKFEREVQAARLPLSATESLLRLEHPHLEHHGEPSALTLANLHLKRGWPELFPPDGPDVEGCCDLVAADLAAEEHRHGGDGRC